MNQVLFSLAETLGRQLLARQWQLALAESCTGGGIAKLVTDVAGSSAWFERGFVTYSNVAKVEMLGVSAATLVRHGAVSSQTALEMVRGALAHSHADLALAVTGIAGPDGGSADKPVGTVFIAWQRRDHAAECQRLQLQGDRQQIRQQVAEQCLQRALQQLA